MDQRKTPQKNAHGQSGVYAVEWAIVFPFFFVLLYAIISYGLTFLVRESMQFALEDGARAALRYPVNVQSPTWNDRKDTAIGVAVNHMNWLPAQLRPQPSDIRFTVCPVLMPTCSTAHAFDPAVECSVDMPCLVLMSYVVDSYPSRAIAPVIFNVLLPQRITASATILVDRRLF